MKFLLDENVPEGFIKVLKKNGYKDITHINKLQKGLPDKEVFDYAVKNRLCIVSHDSDFDDFQIKPHYGIIRVKGKVKNKEESLIQLLSNIKKEDLIDTYFCIDVDDVYKKIKKYTKRKNKRFKQFHKIHITLE